MLQAAATRPLEMGKAELAAAVEEEAKQLEQGQGMFIGRNEEAAVRSA